MRHLSKKKYFNRSGSHRNSLSINLIRSLIDHEKITTSESKAKFIKPAVEKIITLGKRDDLASRRKLIKVLGNNTLATKVLKTIAPKFMTRQGGYLKIIKLNRKPGDASKKVYLTFVT